MPRKIKSNRFELDDANRRDDIFLDEFGDEDEIDPEVQDIFEEAQQFDYGSDQLLGKMSNYTSRSPKLTGGDLDASWEYADIGEEAVGGQNPTPDQSLVDDAGEAMGITYADREPLGTTRKLERRDREPWELDPRSSADYRERVRQEFGKPLKKFVVETETKPKVRNVRSASPSRKTDPNKQTRSQARKQPARKNTRAGRTKARH
ncbi:MAG: hypothetical protein HZB51_21800 [Chloroflexi bacterium]|nr:hypothetical protein [Chloroflexota bacterium]